MASTTTTSSSASAAMGFPATGFPGGGGDVSSNSTFTLFGPPPPFPAPPRSIDFSPLKFIFAVFAIIAVPALAYAIFFSFPCHRRRSFSADELPSSAADIALAPSPPPQTMGVSGEVSSAGNECSICLSVIGNGEKKRELSACKHAFHASCIEKWLAVAGNSTCPNCRTAVNVNGNRNGGSGGGNRRVSAINRVDDWHQGLPDASNLV